MNASQQARRLPMARRALLWLAAAGLAFASGRSVVGAVTWARAMARSSPGPDVVTQYEQGLGGARAVLAGQRTIGYAFEGSNYDLMSLGYEEQTVRFQLAQYALAPAVISRVGLHRWVFADFATPAGLRAHAAENGYRIRWTDGRRGVLEAPAR